MMTFGSVCSGIEAASVAWHGMGWRAAWLAEIEPFPSALLAHHYPDVPNLGDMTTIADKVWSGDVVAPDVLVGGTPCQAFSVAGLRQSLDDDRGQLSLEFVRLANAIDSKRSIHGKQPAIIVWENVPGVLNTKDNAFGCFLAGLAGEGSPLQPAGGKWTNAGCVFGPQRTIAYRVLDAQFFGVPQRRRRVFVVASARDAFDPSQILFEFDGVRRDIAPSRKTGQEIAGDAGGCFTASSFGGYAEGVGTIRAQGGDSGGGSETLAVVAFPTASNSVQATYGIPGNWIGRKPENGGNAVEPMHDVAPCLTGADRHGVAVCFQQNTRDEVRLLGGDGQIAGALMADAGAKQQNYICERPVAYGISESPYVAHCLRAGASKADKHESTTYVIQAGEGCGNAVLDTVAAFKGGQGALAGGIGYSESLSPTLTGSNQVHCLMQVMAVRRLLPVECERLQGFPDHYTRIPYRKKTADLCPDSPRYKALGNSMAVPCMAWIGKRIADYVGVQP